MQDEKGIKFNPRDLLSPDLINKIIEAENEYQRQDILNETFPIERREEMIASASEDNRGHKVIYLRKITLDKLQALLEKGVLEARDYFKNLEDQVDINEFKYFLIGYAEYTGVVQSMEEAAKLKADSIEELLNKIFPNDAEAMRIIAENPSQGNILTFVQNNFDQRFMRKVHTGSMHQMFSSWLSAHIGGPGVDVASLNNSNNSVYVEMVIPDNEVMIHPECVEGEKEVLLNKITVDWVSRIYSNMEQLIYEELFDQRTAVGDYFYKHNEIVAPKESFNNFYKAAVSASTWRWEEKTSDCWPTSLSDHK